MKLPYGYVLVNGEIVIHEEKADAVCSIFEDYLVGASLGKIVDMFGAKGILSPSDNLKWTRAAVNKLLSNANYIAVVGVETYIDVQFEREYRCNVDYEKTGYPRKVTGYQSPYLNTN